MVKRDSKAFRERFKAWKNGEQVYENGRPVELSGYRGGKDDESDNELPLGDQWLKEVTITAPKPSWLRELEYQQYRQEYLQHPEKWPTTHEIDPLGKPRVIGMSGTDPIGEFFVANAVLNPIFNAAGKAALYGLGRAGNNWARAKLISGAMNKSISKGYSVPLTTIKKHSQDSGIQFNIPKYSSTELIPEGNLDKVYVPLTEYQNGMVYINGNAFDGELMIMNRADMTSWLPTSSNPMLGTISRINSAQAAKELAKREYLLFYKSNDYLNRLKLAYPKTDPKELLQMAINNVNNSLDRTTFLYMNLEDGLRGVTEAPIGSISQSISLSNNPISPADYNTLRHEMGHAIYNNYDGIGQIPLYAGDFSKYAMEHNYRIMPLTSSDVISKSLQNINTELAEAFTKMLEYIQDPSEFSQRMKDVVLEARRRGLTLDSFIRNGDYKSLNLLKNAYSMQDLIDFGKNMLGVSGLIGPSLIMYNNTDFKHGKDSGIYIKPSHRGKFTALKKRTGHSASWFKAHGTPALKKMATFELNSKKWHRN